MSLTKAGNNLIIPSQIELVSDIPAGDGKIINLFYSVHPTQRKKTKRAVGMVAFFSWIK
jgi:hypothetical protein